MNRFLLPLLALLTFHFSASAQDHRQMAAQYLQEHREELSLTASDLEHWIVSTSYMSKHNGVTHIHLQQRIHGIDVFNGVSNLAVNKEGRVFHAGHNLISSLAEKVNTTEFSIDQESAVAAGKRHHGLTAEAVEATEFSPVYYPAEDAVRLSWHIMLHTADHQHIYNLIVDGTTGDILDEWDQVLHCSFGKTGFRHPQEAFILQEAEPVSTATRRDAALYNVFPYPVESPSHGARAILSNPADPIASPFGWHDNNGVEGADFTITRGNNVWAYEDADNNNSPGYSPDGGANLIFDFPYADDVPALDNQDASITNLFYWNNTIHDFMYQYGFDEPSGNFQANNYGNGGSGGDEVRAEGLDGAGFNNANFSTLSDGINPRMQMFLWTGEQEYLTINSPVAIAGEYITGTAAFGPGIPTTPLTADVVLYDDGVFFPHDACEDAVNASELNGKIALIDRRDCTFVLKIQRAQNAGAVGVIMANNVEGSPITMGGTSATINIPSVMVSFEDGNAIKAQLNNDVTVSATIFDDGNANPPRDGSFDNGVITHEYGHGISTRLVGGRFNSNCLNNQEQMGEGWSDWFGMMLTMNMDLPDPVYRPIGTFAISEQIDGFGIRPAPYDTSFTVNDYTYADLPNDEISVPHGVGFIWSTMLWDLTWAFIGEYGFDEDLFYGTGGNNKVMQLIIDALKITNCGPGFVAGRNAILAADEATFGGIHKCMIWEVFARRGLGFSASQGNPNNVNDGTAAFDMPSSCSTEFAAGFLVDATSSCSGVFEFTDESTGSPTSWNWDFGDGNTSTEQNPAHTYTESGTYTVTLTSSNGSESDTDEQNDLVTVDLPVTPVNAPDVLSCVGTTATLTATSPHTTTWYTAGGALAGTGSPFTTAVLSGSTTFTVQDELTINGEKCESDAVTVNVTAASASFSASTDELTVSFTDLSTNATSWLWTFGDGTTSTLQSPVHTYAAAGAYNVTLTVNGSCTFSGTVDAVASGLENAYTAAGVDLVPNPAVRTTVLRSGIALPEGSVVNIISADGRTTVLTADASNLREVAFDISPLANGMYHVLVYDGEELIIQKKLVISRN